MIINIECLKDACDELNIEYEFLDKNKNLLKIKNKNIYFSNTTTPLNSEEIQSICKDKEFTYDILQNIIDIPRLKGYLDPNCGPDYQMYLEFHSIEDITNDIIENFSFPVIIKKNSGSMGNNVFLCRNNEEVKNAVNTVFNPNSKSYDYVCLAQKYIEISKEYRVIVVDGKITFMYEKNKENAEFVGNLSPLHWKNSKAILVENKDFIDNIQSFIEPIFNVLNLRFGGLDIALDSENKLWLIELNTKPGFSNYIKNNNKDILINMYKIILNKL